MSNEVLSVEHQLVGMPLAGPESFSAEQLQYLKRALGVDETVLWEDQSKLGTDPAQNWSLTLSETLRNFKYVVISCSRWGSTGAGSGVTSYTLDTSCFEIAAGATVSGFFISGTTLFATGISFTPNTDRTALTVYTFQAPYGSTSVVNTKSYFNPYKIVGIGRKQEA